MTPSTPRYLEIADRLAAAIRAGQSEPGSLLPGEVELATLHRVSRTTIRQALTVLELEGHVRRERGRRTIVSRRLLRHLDPLLSFDYDMETQGIGWKRDVVDSRMIVPAVDVRLRLGLSSSNRVLFVRENRIIAGRPCSLNERYIHPAFRELYQEEVKRGVAMYAVLAERSGDETYAEMELRVGPAPPAQARLLALKRGTLVLLARFVNYVGRTRPMEMVDAFYPIDRWQLVFQRLAVVDSARHPRVASGGDHDPAVPRMGPPARA
jgi:GntR family transcriptional regulator